MLTDENSDRQIYRPEGSEDLAIFDAQQRLIEAVQVKDYSSDLALSHFKPSRSVGFFARFKVRQIEHPDCDTRLASFGALGPEFCGAISGDSKHRGSVIEKLTKANISLSSGDVVGMLDDLQDQVEFPSTKQLRANVLTALEGTIAGGHAESSLELLLYWVFDASENQRDLTRSDLLLQLQNIGDYLAALRDTSHEWGVTVRPVVEVALSEPEKERWTREYRQGVQARWEHIQAEADFPRADRLNQIHRQLQQSAIVIVRGASGQGKSSLGWRYLYDFCAKGLRFHVRLVEGREHALRVANALRAHVLRLRLQAVVYLDVSPSDTGWPELVRELASFGLKVLVTIREEDYRRAGVAVSDFDFSEVMLDGVTRSEAEPIYNAICTESGSSLDFEDVWSRFSAIDEGPLLEFTYLATEGESLSSRIKSQILRIQSDASNGENGLTPSHLELLALAAVANAADARVEFMGLCDAAGLLALSDPLAVLEDEFLVRLDEGPTPTVAGLHSLRSRALVDAMLVGGAEQLRDLITRCLPIVIDTDIEIFLLCTFSRHPDQSEAVQASLRDIVPRSWTHAGGIARALLWEGLNRHERANRKTIVKSIAKYDGGWQFVCDTFVGLDENAHKEILKKFDEALGETIEPVSLTSREAVFTPFQQWVENASDVPAPKSSTDWVGAGDVAYWLGHVQLEGRLRNAIEALLPDALPDIPVYYLAEFVSGRRRLGDAAFVDWHDQHCEAISRCCVAESRSVYLADDGIEVKIYFEVDTRQESSDWHAETMKRVDLVRKLFPDRQTFSSQGMGLAVLSGILPYDPTRKNISVERLPSTRAVHLNSVFSALVSYRHRRPDTWASYRDTVWGFRLAVSDCFRKLHRGWGNLIGEPEPKAKTVRSLPGEELAQVEGLSHLPMYPKVVVDEWGFVSEGKSENPKDSPSANIAQSNIAGAIKRFEPWKKAADEYESCINSICGSFVTQTVVFLSARRGTSPGEPEACETFLRNLAGAWASLSAMQREYRKLFDRIDRDKDVGNLEKHEQINFRHVWSAAIGLLTYSQRPLRNAVTAIEQECIRRRSEFLKALEIEVASELEQGSSLQIVAEPWLIGGTSHLRVVCDHHEIVSADDVVRRVTHAIWRACHSAEWQAFEWIPLTIEWPKIAIVHLVQGRALDSVCATISTNALFSTEETFEPQLHHMIPTPVDADEFAAGGFNCWEGPLLRAVQSMNREVTEFVTTYMRFHEILTMIVDCEPDDEKTDDILSRYSIQLSSVLTEARHAFASLDLMLEMIDSSVSGDLRARLRELCSVRIVSLAPEADIHVDIDSFGEWVNDVEESSPEFESLLTDMISHAVKIASQGRSDVNAPL
ncbi:hypothetical protein [Neorhodopirellula lusitana]|uniref:hypothetical protein n=1 Tax=Neorhodopirellula lusitana TaxID=445327 RepID=UPI00384B0D55